MEPLEHCLQVMQLDANGLNAMVANTGAGSLEIIGVGGLTNIILDSKSVQNFHLAQIIPLA
ncbi:hypothetical protein [Shewanella benthica]|uniref:Uncharacterized protein n=1 Tax=Shewanella benthica KT99 TaxID=314608 RepID=A9D5H6_9GAMM|nr:hypothetical protein [Shewanella benthica]EDQ01403.1 hypothetical protein KT99_02161 [Shewanella benthica KT99]